MNDSHKGKKSKAAVESKMSSGGFCHRGGKRGMGKLTSFLCCFVNNQAGRRLGAARLWGCESKSSGDIWGSERRGSGAVSLRGPWGSGDMGLRAAGLRGPWDSGAVGLGAASLASCGTQGLWGSGAVGPLLRLVQEESGNGLQQITELHKSTNSFIAGMSEAVSL